MAERSEEDVVTGVLQIELGAVVKTVPTLKAKYVGEWMQQFAPGAARSKPLGEWSESDVVTLPSQNVERMLDLITAYDSTGALPGREWLAENADPTQLYRATVQMIENANPFVDAPTFLALMLIRGAVKSGQPSSMNGASPSGASTPKKSARGSTRSS